MAQWESAIFDQAAPNLKLNGLPYTAFLADPARAFPLRRPTPSILSSSLHLNTSKEALSIRPYDASLPAAFPRPFRLTTSLSLLSFAPPAHRDGRHPVIEPFDEPLDRRLRSLAAEQELIAVQLAERRSATPLAIRGLVADLAERKRVGERTVGGPEGGDAEGAMDGVEEQGKNLAYTLPLDALLFPS